MTRVLARSLRLSTPALAALTLVACPAVMILGSVPAGAKTVTVTCPPLSGSSLQDAIDTAPNGSTITIGGTCKGNLSIPGTNASLTNLTLKGLGGAAITILDGGGGGSVISLTSAASVTITGVTITDGTGTPDGLNRFQTNFVGGGLYNQGSGTVTLKNSVVSANSASEGGAVYNNGGTVTLQNTVVTGNTGGGIFNGGGTVALQNSVVTGSSGPGIFTQGGTVTLKNSPVSDNTNPYGAGVANNGGTVSLFKSPVTGNTAFQGGGIFNSGTLNLTRSPVVSNTATGGPGYGGGILNNGGTVMLKKSPVTGNAPDNCDGC